MPDPYETVAVSGGMDPVHKGHVRMIQEASQFGEVIVILNSDEWLMRKKGFVFMSWDYCFSHCFSRKNSRIQYPIIRRRKTLPAITTAIFQTPRRVW